MLTTVDYYSIAGIAVAFLSFLVGAVLIYKYTQDGVEPFQDGVEPAPQETKAPVITLPEKTPLL